ncbi:MAG TPA: hypothetical protein VK901_10295, partial [Nitrospiraceae bacterium]|nr:hypothetical protein [Nitrospiraceae bacterium]
YCLPPIRSSFNIRSERRGKPAKQGREGSKSYNHTSNHTLPVIIPLSLNRLLICARLHALRSRRSVRR